MIILSQFVNQVAFLLLLSIMVLIVWHYSLFYRLLKSSGGHLDVNFQLQNSSYDLNFSMTMQE